MLAILKDTSIYVVGDILTKGVNFLSIVFYTHFISQAEMGVLGYIAVITGFASAFLCLGLENAYVRYFFEYKNLYQKQVLTSTLFSFFIAWMIVLLFIPIMYSDFLSFVAFGTYEYKNVFLFALLALSLNLLSSMLNQVLRNDFRTKAFIFFNFLTAFFSVGSTLLMLMFTHLGLVSVFLGSIVGNVVIFPFRFYAVKEYLIINIDFDILKKILAFGIPFLPASVAYWVFSSADRVMLEYMSNFESLGIYTVAVSLSAVMSLLANAVSQSWSPHAVKTYEEDSDKAKVLYLKFFKILVVSALSLIFCVSMLGKEVINVVFPQDYEKVFYPLLFLLIGIGFQITTQITAVGIGLNKKTYYIVYISFFVATINVFLNYMLIPFYGEAGAAFSTMLSYFLLTTLYSFVSQKLFHLEYDFKFIILSIILLIVICFASYMNLFFRLFLILGVLTIFFRNKNKILNFVSEGA